VFPLLDGLDEMEEDARPDCIAAINTYHREHLRPLVICSRTSEYEAATRHERLALHTAVVVQPLERRQVDAYLASLGEPLAALRVALKTNTLLQGLATTPLMLQILMLTYHGTSMRTLPRQEAQLREQLWTDYIQRMIERKGDKRRYPFAVTTGWLSRLASMMRQHNQTIFSLKFLKRQMFGRAELDLLRVKVLHAV
jgi:predicted NACHT family NTPase